MLEALNKLEFMTEHVLLWLNPKIQHKSIIEIMAVYEILKVFQRTKIFFTNQENLFIENRNPQMEKLKSVKERTEKNFIYKILSYVQ